MSHARRRPASRGAQSGWEIYSMKPDGSGVVRLTNSPGLDYLSSWSPDGKQISFANSTGIYIMNADNREAG
jgi:TolB protein